MPLILLALSIANLIAFGLFAIDKTRARSGRRRIPERTLLTAALFGGLGAVLGQRLLRHKTRKQPFAAWLGLILTLHVLLLLSALVLWLACPLWTDPT
ncbi:DUF1294 domain-containing protein [Brevundimonas sp.]|uniref:DUF1294 domain-containing protein n=1 Tax=Brevundimonas sp. TaxID=1871086 RepID=UPI0028AC82B6|nr:DUF1294 domain-containing protein [Brevundimonas sp.]